MEKETQRQTNAEKCFECESIILIYYTLTRTNKIVHVVTDKIYFNLSVSKNRMLLEHEYDLFSMDCCNEKMANTIIRFPLDNTSLEKCDGPAAPMTEI